MRKIIAVLLIMGSVAWAADDIKVGPKKIAGLSLDKAVEAIMPSNIKYKIKLSSEEIEKLGKVNMNTVRESKLDTILSYVLATKNLSYAIEKDGTYIIGNKFDIQNKMLEFTLKDLDGKDVSLKDYRDKKAVLLVFWATWCSWCIKEIPELKRLCEVYKGKDFVILGINFKESKEKAAALAKKENLPYTVLLDGDGAVAKNFGVMGFPTNILINKKGQIKVFVAGAMQNPEKEIDSVLRNND